MKHEPAGDGQSVMIYTCTIETGPAMQRWPDGTVATRIVERQTHSDDGFDNNALKG